MKKILKIGLISSLLLTSSLFSMDDMKESDTIKGVVFENYGITIEKGSEVEKELKEVLKKFNMLKEKKIEINEPKVTLMEPVVVTPKIESNKIEVNIASCTSCHGKEFEKKALGKSKVVKDMTKEEILNALNGYQEGTYGETMKAIMVSQLSKYTKEEISIIADKIKN